MPKRAAPTIVRTFEEARSALADEPRIALDLETSGFSPWRARIHVVALYGAESHTIAILHYPKDVPVEPELLEWLGERPEIVTHNGVQFDLLFLAKAGMDWRYPLYYDTLIGEQAVTVSERKEIGSEAGERRGMSVSLQAACKRQLGVWIDKSIDHGRWGAPELDENQLAYVAGDIAYMLALREAQYKKAETRYEDGRLKYPGMRECIDFEMELAKVVLEMQITGLTVDRSAVNQYLAELRASDSELEPRIRALLDIPIDEVEAHMRQVEPRLLALCAGTKPDKIPAALKQIPDLGVELKRGSALARLRANGSTLLSSSDQLLAALAIRYGPRMFQDTTKETLSTYMQIGGELGTLCKDLLRWRQLAKRESMFDEAWFAAHTELEDGRAVIHGHFLQLGTNTGRYAAREPNLQQIPKDMRHCFGNRPGWAFGHSDYMGIELRVMAAMAADENMIAAFAAGEDIHAAVVAAAFGKAIADVTPQERRLGKAMNFTLTFGGSWHTFYSYAHANGAKLSEEEAESLFEAMLHRFSGVARLRRQAEETMARGRPVMLTFPTGLRRQLLPGIHKPTTLLNNAVQATAAAGIKKGQLEIRDAGYARFLVAVVHDEIDYEAPVEQIEEVRTAVDAAMLRGMQWAMHRLEPVMLGVESSWGPTWAENPDTLRASEAPSHPEQATSAAA